MTRELNMFQDIVDFFFSYSASILLNSIFSCTLHPDSTTNIYLVCSRQEFGLFSHCFNFLFVFFHKQKIKGYQVILNLYITYIKEQNRPFKNWCGFDSKSTSSVFLFLTYIISTCIKNQSKFHEQIQFVLFVEYSEIQLYTDILRYNTSHVWSKPRSFSISVNVSIETVERQLVPSTRPLFGQILYILVVEVEIRVSIPSSLTFFVTLKIFL